MMMMFNKSRLLPSAACRPTAQSPIASSQMNILKHPAIVFRLQFYLHRISTAAAWHPIKPKPAPLKLKLPIVTHLHFPRINAIMPNKKRCGQLPGSNHRAAFRERAEQSVKVRSLYYLQILIGSRPCGTVNAQASVEQGNAFILQKLL